MRKDDFPKYPREWSMWNVVIQGIGVWMMASGAIFLLLLIFGD